MSEPRVFYPRCRAILQVVFERFEDDEDSETDDEPIVIPVIPRSCTVHRNSYNQADSYELGFDAGDLPFDPRIIRAGAVEIYMYQTDGLEGVGQILSRRDPLADVNADATSGRSPTETLGIDVAAVAAKDRFTSGHRKPMIAGLFDSSGLDMSEDGKWISISGQDYTAHLASLQWKPEPSGIARRIPIGKRLDLQLAEILEEADPGGKLSIDVRGLDREKLPIVGHGEARASARGITVEQQTSYWDVIYKLVIRYGLIAYVDGLDIVITRPKTITTADSGSIKRLAWGRNLETLRLTREFGKEQVPTIVVRSFDPATKKTISVEYPAGQLDHGRYKPAKPSRTHGTKARTTTTEKHRAKPPAKKKKTATTVRRRDEYQIVTVHGISDREVLRRIAENRYHLLGKSERRVVATTRDLKDFRALADGGPQDLLELTAGDAVSIEWDEFNAELLATPGIPDETKIDHLVDRGFNRSVARVIVSRYGVLEALDRPLRVKEVSYTFDVDDGIGIELELYDFIMIEGIRPGSGAAVPSRGETHRAGMVGEDGAPIGGSEAQRAANQRRHGR